VKNDDVKRLLLTVTLGIAGLAAAVSGQNTQNAPPQSPAFRAAIDIVSLNVTVTDGANRYVTDLEEADFQIFEDGVRQEVSFFSRRQQPIALSMLLDSSASMEDKLPTLQTAAGNFVRRLNPNDIAQVIDFDSRVDVRQVFTGSQPDLLTAIDRIAAGGSTSLHNAIYIALKELRKVRAVTEQDIRRQALVVFSDGEDTSSLVSFDEAVGNLDIRHRSAWRGRADERVSRGGVRHADAGARNRRPLLLPRQGRRPERRLLADCRRARQSVHDRLHVQEPAT
jgi:hypothetical protein